MLVVELQPQRLAIQYAPNLLLTCKRLRKCLNVVSDRRGKQRPAAVYSPGIPVQTPEYPGACGWLWRAWLRVTRRGDCYRRRAHPRGAASSAVFAGRAPVRYALCAVAPADD